MDEKMYKLFFVWFICKTISVHTKRHITLHTFEHHHSRHAPCWTHVSQFHEIAARSVLIVTCFQSSDFSRSWGWSPYRNEWSWLMPSPCQHLSGKGELKISVRFSSHHMKIKGCNCWQWPGPTGGKRAFLFTSMFDGWLYSYWPSYLHCQHAPCEVLGNALSV